jgi:RNAse (barnase) inhibitor barstar
MNNIFGNKTGGLFGNNNPSGNTGGGLFGNNNPSGNTGGGLFGNNNPSGNTGGGLFGNNNPSGNTGGGLFGNNNPSGNTGGGLFGNNNPSGNNNQTGFFNNNQQNNNNINNQIYQQPNYYTSVNPIIELNKKSSIRNLQLNKLPDVFHKEVLKIKLELKRQEIKLDELQRYSQRLVELIEQSDKSVEKMGEFNDFINKKLNKYESIVNQINENYKTISESFEQEQKNINLMEQDLGLKIEIPSKFLINYSQNLYNKTIVFNQKLNDISTLIKVYYSQSHDNMTFDTDIIESTLAEFIKVVRNLLESNERQEKMINDMYHIILEFARNNGENPETVKNNIMQNAMQ